jgi:tRNA nucleotidyltransferase/poly(A) polymerase
VWSEPFSFDDTVLLGRTVDVDRRSRMSSIQPDSGRRFARVAGSTVTLGESDALRPLLAALAEAIGGPAWLVGGAVRDLLLGRSLHDVDLALPAGSVALARRLADRLGGAFVPLGEPHGMARVVVPGPEPRHVDLTDLRASSLDADLAGRDVTIDALAVDLTALLRGPASVQDPTGGLDDLAARRLRACRSTAFVDDPVRVLRVLRLGHELGFAVDQDTQALARAAAPALASVAAERVRDELTHLLRLERSAPAVRQADAWSVLEVVLPEVAAMREASQSAPHRFTVWEHSLRALEAADALLGDLQLLAPHHARISASFGEPMGSGLTRREVWKLAVLLHDVAKPETRSVDADGRTRFIGHDRLGADRAAAIARRLAWPGRAVEVLARLVRHHLRPMHLGMLDVVTARARYRFHRDVGEEVPALLCLTVADAAGTDGRMPDRVYRGRTRALLESLLASEHAATREAAEPPLVRGGDVMAALGLAPGPAVGEALRRTREAQGLGLVRTRDEALAWLVRPQPAHQDDSAPSADGDDTRNGTEQMAPSD